MNTTFPVSHLPRQLDSIPQVLESETRIRFQDCDPFGHLNNAAYFDVFINAREDQLMENYGWDLYKYSTQMQAGWVVAKHEILYRKPTMLNEKVKIRSQLIYSGEKNLRVEIAMYDEKDSHLKAMLWTTFVHVDLKTGRPKKHPAELQPFFEAAVKPASHEMLNERVKEIELGLATATRQ